jgi:hypothetical protein
MIHALMAIASLVSLVILSPRLRMRGTIPDFRESRESNESATDELGY